MLTITKTIPIIPGMRYAIISAFDRKELAHGTTDKSDTFDSIINEANTYIRCNCFAPVVFQIDGHDVADNRKEF